MEEKEIKLLNERSIKKKNLILNTSHDIDSFKSRIKYRKVLVLFIFFILWIVVRIGFHYLDTDEGVTNPNYCLNCKLLTNILYPISNLISQNLIVRDLLLIFASTMLDIGLITFGVIYIKNGNSWAYPLAFLIFYGVRSVVQELFTMQFLDTFVFDNPGFPSIVVPYFRTPDFFYSGHIGCSLILSLSFRDWGYKIFSNYFIFVVCLEAFVMTVTRAHYSIDIIFGFIAGHYFYIISKYLAKYLDVNLPLCGMKDLS